MEAHQVETWRLVLDVVQFVLWAVLGIYVWLSNRHRVTEDRITALEDEVGKRLDRHGQRLSRVEEAMANAPNHGHIGEVYERLNAVHGQLQELIGTVGALTRQMQLINEHLLSKRRHT